jgi:carbamoyltransferase
MKISLGIHVGHDRGACLIKDGKVIASLSQERLDRIKHSQSLKLPFEAIDALLKYCKLTIEDVSCIGLSAVAIEDENTYNMYKDSFFRHYGCEYIPFFLVHHHDAHAYSTYYSSGI